MAIARKEISREFKDNKETIINERKDFLFDISIQEIIEEIFEDYEYARDKGVYWGEDELYMIEVNSLLEECEQRLEDEDSRERDIITYLKKWKDYKIYM